jgi:N-acetylmuramoyl-L-alanine amidase
MSDKHIVQPGEHISDIASDAGFRSYHTVWDRPENSDLRNLRDDPHVLFPGDEVFVPDLTTKTEQRPTTQLHIFQVPGPELFLRLKVLDFNFRAVPNATGQLTLEPLAAESTGTDGDGFVEHELEPKTHKGELALDQVQPKDGDADPVALENTKFDLRIGHLNPETKLSGQQARLNNLGYFAGFTLNDLEQLLWAAEEFECDRVNQSKTRVAARPTLVGIAPSDQKDGEELGDPAHDTGITDAKIRDELVKSHGC